MLDSNSKVLLWDENLAHLASFKAVTSLPATQDVSLYKGQLPVGKLLVFFGYRIKAPGNEDDNSLVTNAQPIDIKVQ
jgi:hypothetical protein